MKLHPLTPHDIIRGLVGDHNLRTLQLIAAEEDVTVTDLIREAVDAFCKDMDEWLRARRELDQELIEQN